MEKLICINCKKEIEKYTEFPGPRCLSCYEKNFIMPSAQEVAAAFRNINLIK